MSNQYGLERLPDFPGYSVTECGKVFSHKTNWRGYGTREMGQLLNADGYPSVKLKRIDGKTVRKTVHALVATTYLGPRKEDQECCHIDGNKQNNHVQNLRWGSKAGNARDRVKHGTHKGGFMVGAKLQAYQARVVGRESNPGASADGAAQATTRKKP